ncbi:MAG: hypothetical protein EPO00_05585 [Chloroflexota bacterium]|nr:MAG: hypothetical protein EPO00_05585 [Chloroflexota bacterium]
MFDTYHLMATLSADVTTALATLQSRWGAAAPRPGEVMGALALAPAVLPDAATNPDPTPDLARVYSTGFPALDAILGPGGLPRGMGLSLRGELSSGRTTIALRLAAEAQASGAIVAWLDLAEAFDPVEAAARGMQLEWLVVLTPAGPEEGLAIAGSLLSGRTVDLLVMDLPPRPDGASRFADRLGRLAALARRAGISLLILEPPGLVNSVAAAVGEGTGIRLELERRSWIRLGRDVVGQAADVVVARSRAGPPGRRTTLRILYADGGDRDACLRQEALLREGLPAEVVPIRANPRAGSTTDRSTRFAAPIHAPVPVPGTTHATPSLLSPASPPRPDQAAPGLRLVAGGPDRPRGPAMGRGDRAGRGSRGPAPRRPARDAARVGSPAGTGGNLPRSGTGG